MLLKSSKIQQQTLYSNLLSSFPFSKNGFFSTWNEIAQKGFLRTCIIVTDFVWKFIYTEFWWSVQLLLGFAFWADRKRNICREILFNPPQGCALVKNILFFWIFCRILQFPFSETCCIVCPTHCVRVCLAHLYWFPNGVYCGSWADPFGFWIGLCWKIYFQIKDGCYSYCLLETASSDYIGCVVVVVIVIPYAEGLEIASLLYETGVRSAYSVPFKDLTCELHLVWCHCCYSYTVCCRLSKNVIIPMLDPPKINMHLSNIFEEPEQQRLFL